jgi:hypothetical protein
MKHRLSNSRGFAVWAVLAAALAIGVLGTGYFVWQRHNADVLKNAQAQTNTNAKQPIAQNPSEQNLASMRVAEWGVSVPLTDPIKDAYFVVSDSSVGRDGKPDTLWLGLTSLNSKGCAVGQKDSEGVMQYPMGALLRTPLDAKDPVEGTPVTEMYPGGTTIDDYYYSYKSATSDKTCASRETLNSIDAAFKNASGKIIKT